jgi:hypothetical protein
MTLKNYESLTLKHSPYEPEWTKVRLLPITGINGYSATNYVIGPIDITYDSDMNNDFSDLRYAIWDGTQFIDCRYYIFSKTDGVTARVFVEIPSLPESPTINYVYRFYGNPIATTTSDPTVLYLFDDFENGQYTNWNVVGGTGSIISTGQIGGTYSFKHQGANTGEGIPVYNSSRLTGLNYVIIDFDFKLLTQGSGSSDPFIGIWYIQYVDSSNFLRLETSWDGTNQYFKLRKMVGGTTTVLSTYTKDAAKYPANETHHFKILYNGSSVTVFVDSNKIINNVVVGSTFSSTRMGMGCLQSASGAWDNIKIRRNLPNFTPIGLEPTLGTLTGESTNISPDSWDDTLQYLLFTLTSDYIANCPICFDVVELDADTYETPDVIGNSGNIFQLGFDHVAKYHALRVVVETDSEKTNLITWNWIKYGYSL